MLARKAIAKWCGVDAESIVFAQKEHGKPYAVDISVEFNISHSGNMVVCVVDDKPVGIDVEQIRPIDLTVAKRICTDEELRYLFGHTPTEGEFTYTTDIAVLTRFFEMWTAKEAYVKCMGTGVADLKTARFYSEGTLTLVAFIKKRNCGGFKDTAYFTRRNKKKYSVEVYLKACYDIWCNMNETE